MKKIIVFSFLLASMSVCGLYAQKEATPKSGEVSSQGTGSTARTKGVGKGTPLVQRQSGGAATSPSESAPATPAENAAKPKSNVVIRDSLNGQGAAKPKAGASKE